MRHPLISKTLVGAMPGPGSYEGVSTDLLNDRRLAVRRQRQKAEAEHAAKTEADKAQKVGIVLLIYSHV